MTSQQHKTSMRFEEHFLSTLAANRFNCLEGNYDTFYRGKEPPKPSILRDIKNGFSEIFAAEDSLSAFKAKAAYLPSILKDKTLFYLSPKNYFRETLAKDKKFEFTYQKLNDAQSQELLVSLLAYRAMGFRKIRLPRNTAAYWEGIETARKLDTGLPAMSIPHLTWPLHCFDVKPLEFDMRVYTYTHAIAINFVQKQYIYSHNNVTVKVEPNDVVIDAGACWGDTSLQFACEAGPNGHVYAFEFAPNNLGMIRKNIEINPHLAKNITVVQHPVGAHAGKKMFFFENGPASRVASTKVDDRYIECKIMSIDRLVNDKNLARVDFIKMDVEGSELDALKGAEKTLRKFKPKLAICVYHKPDDYLTIPKYLDDLQLGYRFYMEHHTIFLGETVLFAVPDSRI